MAGHPFHLHKIKTTELSEVFTSESIKTFAQSMIGLFIPIYLLQQGVNFTNICILYLTLNLCRLILEPFIGHLVARFGAKHVLAWSYPASLTYITMLFLYPDYKFSVLLIALPWALAESMHAVAFFSVFSKIKRMRKCGADFALVNVFATIAGGLGPVTAGFIADKYGLNIIFMLAPILMFFAAIPLYMSLEVVRSERLQFKGMRKIISRDVLAYSGLNVDVVAGATIWPLFIFYFVQDYTKVGAIISLSFIISVAAFMITGSLSDHRSKRGLILFGSVGLSIVNLFRLIASSFFTALGVNIFGKVVGPAMATPMYSMFYKHADQTRRIEFGVMLEMAGDLVRACVWLILLSVSLWNTLPIVFYTSFIMAAIGLLFTNCVPLRAYTRSMLKQYQNI